MLTKVVTMVELMFYKPTFETQGGKMVCHANDIRSIVTAEAAAEVEL